MKKLIYTSFVFFALVLFSSCSEDEENLFSASSADRIAASMKETGEILAKAPNGWLVQYYAGVDDEKVGGINYIFDFNEDGWVDVISELDPDNTYRSLYRLISDQGPVLTFDTYNPVFHTMSEPKGSGSIYGYMGDYEFVVTSASETEITLAGKKYGNIAVMKPFAPDSDKKEYLNTVLAVSEDALMYSVLELYKDNRKIGYGKYSGSYDAYTFKYEKAANDSVEVTFFAAYNPNGITLYEPVDINGAVVSEFVWDAGNHKYTGAGNASNIVIQGDVPEGYLVYDDIPGNYTATFTGYSNLPFTKTVNLAVDVTGKSYKLTGLSAVFDYTLEYSRSSGSVIFRPQALVSPYTGYTASLYPWAGGGSLYVTLTAGDYTGVNDVSGATTAITFVPDGSISAAVGLIVILTDSAGDFYLYDYDHCYRNLVLTKQ
ncbi:MAG: DUF4302 domain-containing protein [Prevotella sp.]|jgi:hypothetical protein|nr:DUF4302 domain-containing protein [Prevotella sp.]